MTGAGLGLVSHYQHQVGVGDGGDGEVSGGKQR